MTQSQPPAGWYPDPSGRVQYWNGTSWTGQYQDQQQAATPPSAPYAQQYGQAPAVPPGYELKKKKRFYQRVWFWVIAIPVVLIIIIVASVSSAVNNGEHRSHTVVYSVTGSGHADIQYDSIDGTQHEQSVSADNQTLPWTKTLTVKGDFSTFSVIANSSLADIGNGSGSSNMTCTLTVDGKQVASDQSSGTANIVTCAGSGLGSG